MKEVISDLFESLEDLYFVIDGTDLVVYSPEHVKCLEAQALLTAAIEDGEI